MTRDCAKELPQRRVSLNVSFSCLECAADPFEAWGKPSIRRGYYCKLNCRVDRVARTADERPRRWLRGP
jgi:hypothetical protein